MEYIICQCHVDDVTNASTIIVKYIYALARTLQAM